MARTLKRKPREVGGRGVLSLFLLRHGETEFSRGDRFCGHIDAPLTAAGHTMGRLFADGYAGLPWRAVITSTRRRTVATAEPLADRLALPIRQDGRLDEMFFGDWQGLTKSEAAARDPAFYARWRADPTVGAPGGESPLDVVTRAMAAIDDMRARYDGGNLLVVSHKTVLRLLLCNLLNIELRRYREWIDWPAGALTVVDIAPGHAAVRCVADERHLYQPRNPEKGSEPPATDYAGQSPASPNALYQQPARDFVREEEPGFGELDVDFVDGQPAGSDDPLDFEITTDNGIDAVTDTMGGAVDPGSGA
jgi:probable phosphoglycerate mutase